MDKGTRLAAIAALAKAAAEIAADIATDTSEAAGAPKYAAQNLIIGNLMPAREKLDKLRATLDAAFALHTMGAV